MSKNSVPGNPDRIEYLKRRLYSRKNPLIAVDERTEIGRGQFDVKENWGDTSQAQPGSSGAKKLPFSFTSKLFIGSLIFFLISLGVAAVIFFGGINRVSPKNVDISVLGPVSISGGEELSLEVIVQNNNSVDLENVVLSIAFPEGSRKPGNLSSPLAIEKIDIGEIAAGESSRRTVKAVLFGEKDTVQQIKVSTEYKIRTSNAEFQKEKIYEIAIGSSPVIMAVDYPKEVNVNQDIVFSIDIASNTNQPLEDIVIRAEYPFGFVFKSSEPGTYADSNVWHLGNLKPLEKRTLLVRGFIEAQNNEERTFRFLVGRASEEDDRQIGVSLTNTTLSVTIKKPQLALGMAIGGWSDREFFAEAGMGIPVELIWKNNLPVNIENARIEAKVTGPILNKESLRPGSGGYYRSADDIIMWDKFVTPPLGQIGPGSSSQVSFSFVPYRVTADLIAKIRNPEILIEANMEGNRIEGGLPQKVTGTITRKVKIGTGMDFIGKLLHSVGPFENSGPIPPKADTETTYTVSWAVTNTFNDVSGGRVTAALPPYVQWKGVWSPANEQVSFNPLTQEVVWDFKELKRGTGYISAPREVFFQIGVTPSLSHVDAAPPVINNAAISARDNFTGQTIRFSSPGLSTHLKSDPLYEQGEGNVVK